MKSITLSLLIALTLSWRPSLAEERTHSPEKVVGVILPLSGDLGRFGEKVRQGIELAAKQYGGDAKLIFEDGEASKPKALSAYQKLASLDGVRYFIGPFGPDQTFVVAAPGQKQGSLFLSVSLCDERFKNLSNVFCIYPSQREQIEPLTSLFEARFTDEVRRVAILIEEVEAAAPYHELIAEYSKRSGAKVVYEAAFPHETSDFRGYLLRLKKTAPDLLIVGALSPQTVVQAFRQAGELGLKLPFRWYLSEHDSRFFAENRKVLEGVYTTGAPELGAEFIKSFRSNLGFEPDLYAAVGYEAARVLLTALRSEAYAQDPAKVAKALIAQRGGDSAIRGFQFSTERFVSMLLKPKQFRDGALVDISAR